jgi:hypothetical protein
MTDRSRVPNRSAVDLSAVVPWVNDAGEEIPAFGVVQLRTAFDTTSHASKPDNTSGLFFVNGPVPVASAKRGESLVWNKPRVVLLDAAASVGDEVGPTDGSWEMSDGGVGFRVLQQAADGIGVVVQVGGGSGGGHTIWFTIDSVLCPETDYVDETTLVVTATYYNQSCTGTPPGSEYGGEYYVYDICNYLSGLTPQDLVGTTGRATYHYPLTGYCEPRWIIDDLCAQPECE